MAPAPDETAERPGRPRALHGLLLATIGLPALAFFWGMRDGQVAFVVYREPKLAALEALGPLLLAALAWGGRPALRGTDLLARLRRPVWALLALFLFWGAVTGLWAAVPENFVHELGQWALLLALALALDAWTDRDPAVPDLVELGLVASLGLAAAVAIVQTAVAIPILSPIDPQAAANPSVFGYKNPMALALAGQVFLLARRLGARPERRLPLLFLLAAEVACLGTLNSRTAWGAVAGGALVLGVLLAARGGRAKVRAPTPIGPIATALGLGAVLGLLVLAADAGLRGRAASLGGYLSHPEALLASDRGIYLRNTLNMARFHPFGVGLGDWQTQYPLYRRLRRDLFTDTAQVRMAHSDFTQTLGETGWPGLALWLGFCGLLVATPALRCLRTGEPAAAFAAAQATVFPLAMLTDGLVQHPYGKLQLVLVAFLAVRAGEPDAAPPPPEALPAGRWSGPRHALAAILATAAVVLAGCRIRQAYLAASLRDLAQEVDERIGSRPGPPRLTEEDRKLLAEMVRQGGQLLATPGYAKERCDDLLVLAHAELLLGQGQQALIHTRQSLRLHPYNPAALSLMATAFADRPVKAGLWRRAHDHVLYEATHGFVGRYPGGWR